MGANLKLWILDHVGLKKFEQAALSAVTVTPDKNATPKFTINGSFSFLGFSKMSIHINAAS